MSRLASSYPAVLPVRRALLLLITAAALLVPAAQAGAAPIVGFGEQSAAIFSDARWKALSAPHVRVVVAWDALHYDWQRREIDDYMLAAQLAGAKVVVAFGRSRDDAKHEVLPSLARYRREFNAFRKRYPFLREFITWNEANHCSQPTCRRPDAVARYYRTARAACRRCTILAASVLDSSKMPAWIRSFERVARVRKPIWGLHNYIDANRFRTTGTRAMLKATRGKVWLTETGGIVKRPGGSPFKFKEGTKHAAIAMSWLFRRLVPMSRRIERVYVYHWLPDMRPTALWDSAVIDKRGRARPAFKVVARAVRASTAARARRGR